MHCNTKIIIFIYYFTIVNSCIFYISLEHSRNFKNTHDHTINRGIWHYSKPIWFSASLKPNSYLCTLLHIIYFLLSYFSLPHSISMSFSIYLSRDPHTIFSLFSTSLVLILSASSTIPNNLNRISHLLILPSSNINLVILPSSNTK